MFYGHYALLMALTGFLWVLLAPGYPYCYFGSMYLPWVFAAGGLASFARFYDRHNKVDDVEISLGLGDPKDAERGFYRPEALPDGAIERFFVIGMRYFLYAWGALMFSGLLVGLGWFLGIVFCVNALPLVGIEKCLSCRP